MRISLCMIVKDEIENIEKCLEYALPNVDETIIVDTGSTDGTREVLSRFVQDEKIKVIDAIWEDDFSKARNISIKEATGDYILVLDADERLFCQRENLEKKLEQSDKDVFFVPIYSIYENKEMSVSRSMIRLYKNINPHYEGAIHEQIHIDGNTQMGDVIDSDVAKIYHYGYSESVFEEKEKQKRNMQIIKKQIQEEPYDPFHRYNKGVMELMAKNYKTAMKDFVKAHELSHGVRKGFHNDMMINMIKCLILQNKYQKVIDFIKPLMNDPFFKELPDIYYFLGMAFRQLKRYDLAIKNLEKAIYIGDTDKGLSLYGAGSYLSLLEWARTLADQSRMDEAIEKYKQALKNPNNHNHNGQEEFLQLMQKMNKEEQYNAFVKSLENSKNNKPVIDETFKTQIKEKIKALINTNSIADAKMLIDEYLKLDTEDADIYSLNGVIYILEKNYPKAIECLEIGFTLDNTNDDLIYNLAYAWEMSGNKAKALKYYQALLALPGQSEDREILQKIEELSR